jgi:glutathione peroxidase
MRIATTLTVTLFTLAGLLAASPAARAECNNLLDYQSRRLHSEQTLDLCSHARGKVLLVVNTASQCGFTPQFKGLESLYQRYRDDGFTVVGFPSDDFRQEYADEQKTASVCFINYGVTFPMMSASAVTGANANTLFRALAEKAGPPRWNFHKYLIGRDGTVIAAFPSSEKPLGGALETQIRAALEAPAP